MILILIFVVKIWERSSVFVKFVLCTGRSFGERIGFLYIFQSTFTIVFFGESSLIIS